MLANYKSEFYTGYLLNLFSVGVFITSIIQLMYYSNTHIKYNTHM